MKRYDSPYGMVELTDERLNHIITFHPDVVRYRKYFKRTLGRPEIIRRSKYDPQVYVFYGRVSQGKFLAIVAKTNSRNFVLTAYLTHKISQR